MASESLSLRFKEFGRPDPGEIAEFLYLFRATYDAAVQLNNDATVPMTPEGVRAFARRLKTHLKSLDAVQRDRLFNRNLGTRGLVTEHISQESPLEFVFLGIVVAFAAAVILSGGSFEIPGILKVTLPKPLGDGIKKLRQRSPSQKKARVSAKLNGRLGDAIRKLRRGLAPGNKVRIGYGVRWTRVKLSKRELDELLRQDPAQRRRGGFQWLLVHLQKRVNRNTRVLELDGEDIDRIIRYARQAPGGGFQNRIRKIFYQHFELDDV